jgi:predicted aconitase with swiveling domain
MTSAARAYAAGRAHGPALVLSEPLSLWGGVDVASGRIIDRAHPQRGACITGSILVMPGGRGSSSSASILAECIRRGTGPAGILLATPDPILTVGAIVARALYGVELPIVVCSIDGIVTGRRLRLTAGADGDATVEPATEAC